MRNVVEKRRARPPTLRHAVQRLVDSAVERLLLDVVERVFEADDVEDVRGGVECDRQRTAGFQRQRTHLGRLRLELIDRLLVAVCHHQVVLVLPE